VFAEEHSFLEKYSHFHAVCSDRKSSVVACQETGLEANAEKIKYTIKSRDQNAGQSSNIKIDNNIQ
jgi:hypothetical protein